MISKKCKKKKIERKYQKTSLSRFPDIDISTKLIHLQEIKIKKSQMIRHKKKNYSNIRLGLIINEN